MIAMNELSDLLHRRQPARSGRVRPRGRLPAAVRARADTVLVAVVAALALVPQLSRPGPEMDEGIVLSYAVRVLHGAVPYRDFQEFYGPGNSWSVAAAFGLG